MSDGGWSPLTSPVVWPGGGVEIPPDRVAETSYAAAVAAVVALSGLLLSLLLGSLLHSYHVTVFPESGATVLVGLALGAAIRFGAPLSVRENAAFNQEVFSLVLLPIIIFESGYALDKRPFFSQLWSINAFALLGTLISTVVSDHECGVRLGTLGV
jgi:sodium/hydrogen exchanger 8